MKNLCIVLLGSFLLVSGFCFAEENASNPLAKVKNTDIRAQYHDKQGGSYYWDFWLADGAFMAHPSLFNDIGTIADILGKFQILLCHQDGNPFLFEFSNPT